MTKYFIFTVVFTIVSLGLGEREVAIGCVLGGIVAFPIVWYIRTHLWKLED